MGARNVIVCVALAAVAAVGVAILSGGGDAYRVRIALANATGIREGSEVKIGGVPAGVVSELRLGHGDRVVADLELDGDRGPVGHGASARVVSSGLLGSKFVALDPGDITRPQPSGMTIPRTRVSSPVDLDQVLNVLDPSTRTRLQILINETGTAVAGRKQDVGELLRLLPPSLDDGARMLRELGHDNRALGRLVTDTSSLVGRLADERRHLTRLIDTAADVMDTTAGRQRELREALDRAPGTLRSARGLLADLEDATRPLGPAARALAATAPELATTLDELPDFRDAARPALREATRTAPALTRLASGVTPVLEESRPTLESLESFATTAAPLTRALRVSIDDLLGFLEGWARAIAPRDSLGHAFRGRAVLGAETVRNLVAKLVPAETAARGRKPKARRRPSRPAAAPAPAAPTEPRPAAPTPVQERPELPGVLKKPLEDVADAVTSLLPADERQPGARPQGVGGLLDFLLGP